MAATFEWDPRKERANQLRHGVSFTEAHKDHIHIGLSWAGARKRTSFWAR